MGKLEKHLRSTCPSCKIVATLNFLGEQERRGGNPIPLYNCLKCESTISYSSIRNYNKKIISSSQ